MFTKSSPLHEQQLYSNPTLDATVKHQHRYIFMATNASPGHNQQHQKQDHLFHLHGNHCTCKQQRKHSKQPLLLCLTGCCNPRQLSTLRPAVSTSTLHPATRQPDAGEKGTTQLLPLKGNLPPLLHAIDNGKRHECPSTSHTTPDFSNGNGSSSSSSYGACNCGLKLHPFSLQGNQSWCQVMPSLMKHPSFTMRSCNGAGVCCRLAQPCSLFLYKRCICCSLADLLTLLLLPLLLHGCTNKTDSSLEALRAAAA